MWVMLWRKGIYGPLLVKIDTVGGKQCDVSSKAKGEAPV